MRAYYGTYFAFEFGAPGVRRWGIKYDYTGGSNRQRALFITGPGIYIRLGRFGYR